jgi:hypothetical protein
MVKIKSVILQKTAYLVSFEDGSSALYPRITSVLDVLAKPALMWWAANQEREMCLEAARSLYASIAWWGTSAHGDKIFSAPGVPEFDRRLLEVLGEKKAHQKASQKAKDIGSETHALIQHDLKCRLGVFDPEPQASEPAIWAHMAWEDWRSRTHFEPTHAEVAVASRTLESAGTNDAAGNSNEGFLVCDWKSSKRSKSAPDGIYFEAKVQVAGYRAMGIEMGLFPSDAKACVVRLPKSEDDPVLQQKLPVDFVLLEPSACDALVEGFRAIRATWGFMARYGAI